MAIRMNKTALAVWAITTFACLVLSTTTTRAANAQSQALCHVVYQTNTGCTASGVIGSLEHSE